MAAALRAGNARRQGKEYIAAIEMLARWFSDECPDYKLSDTPNTPFYKYVQIWFQLYVEAFDIANSLNLVFEKYIDEAYRFAKSNRKN